MSKSPKRCPKCQQFTGTASHRRCPADLVARDHDSLLETVLVQKSNRQSVSVSKDWVAQAALAFEKVKEDRAAAIAPVLDTVSKGTALTAKQEAVLKFQAAMRLPQSPEEATAIAEERREVLANLRDPRDGSLLSEKYQISWSQTPALV